jgi:phage-related protein
METMEVTSKPLVILHGEIKSPPFSAAARVEAGVNLRKLQRGMSLTMPISRPMPTIGARCAELRIVDENTTWRIIYRADADAVLIAEVFAKKTQATPKSVIAVCKRRLRDYDALMKGV